MIPNKEGTAMTEVFELRTNEDEKVVVIWLPRDYLQLVVIDLKEEHFWDKIMRHRELDEEFQVYFGNMKELFNAFKVSASIIIEHLQESSDVVISLKVIQKQLKISLKPRQQPQLKRRESGSNTDQLGKSYRHKLIDVCDQNKKLSIELSHKNQQITQLQTQIGLLKLNYDQMAIKMGRIQHELKEGSIHQRKQQSYVTKMQYNTTYPIPLASIEYSRTVQTIKKSSRFEFKPYPNQFTKNFKIQSTRVRLQKEYKDFYQVCSHSPLPQQGRVIIKIQIIHTKASNIYFGIVKQSRRKQKFTCQHKEALSYKLRGGKFLYEDGYQTGEEIPWVKEGEVLSLLVDNEASEVSWTLQQKYMIKRKLPQSMQKCGLYVFVSLHDEGDEVELK